MSSLRTPSPTPARDAALSPSLRRARPPKAFAALAAGSAALTFALVILGAVVRITGSGMGCPDWPLCYGQWLPPWELAAILEWLHRLVAALVSGATVLLLGWIALVPRLRARLAKPAWLLAASLFAQIALGAYTVAQSNSPASVAGHLVMGYVFLGALVTIAWRAAVPADRPWAGWRTTALFVLPVLAVLAQTFIGGLVAAGFAGRACPDFPGCGGVWWPPLTDPMGLQMAHRYGALVVVASVGAVVAFGARRVGGAGRAFAHAACGVTLAQVAIGVVAVLGPFTLPIRTAHQLGAACLFVLCWLALENARGERGEA